jgi:hypothetical protein
MQVETDLELSELPQYCCLQNQISIIENKMDKIQVRNQNQKSIWSKANSDLPNKRVSNHIDF